ncbi:hypothetical protein M4578_21055 [Salipiger sp. P9]|uniref:hypothetical protein n=1 Tax=Salipiger pentaromativorans TaxID=2943193 RepID=UPI0021588352|nr:hypothetical protein [Salipiger pentaromativorans]MCR8550318.1 hypothetical protein [Salipiger pentaromativorans]
MSHDDLIGAVTTLRQAPPELSYPGLSPQLLARVRQLWSAQGLDFDRTWALTVRSLPGFRALPRPDGAPSSAQVDLMFLFDQCVIWVKTLHAAAALGRQQQTEGLDPAQWHGLAAVSARLIDQVTALRLLALTDLPMPAMQIARSVSEDVDMMLVLLARRKLAARFTACRDVGEANEFWRRHIAGGRAFRAITEKLYDVGLDYSADTEYAQWRQQVLAILGAAVHSNALSLPAPAGTPGTVLQNDDSVYFSTFRIHELCAYAQLIRPGLTEALDRAADEAARSAMTGDGLAALAAPLSTVLLSQIQSLHQPAQPRPARGATRH